MKKLILLTVIAIGLLSCNKDIYNTRPTAHFTVTPDTGTVVTRFLFDASQCLDEVDPTRELQLRWDFDSDGVWDTGWDTTKAEVFRYHDEGTYTATLEVKNTEGLTSKQTTSLTIDNRGINYQSFVDERDGQTYYYVQIGDQYWMAENLNYETANSWCYFEDAYYYSMCREWGRLYDWETVMNGESSSNSVPSGVQGICPDGSHLPSDAEWKMLEGTADTHYGVGDPVWDVEGVRGYDAGRRMKYTTGWNNPGLGIHGNGSNMSGFSGLPGGYLYPDGTFQYGAYEGRWWSATEIGSTSAWGRGLSYSAANVGRFDRRKDYGFSVRCVKD